MKRYIGLVTFVLLSLAAQAQTTNHAAYSLFIVNFAKYSSWPDASGDFTIAVVGKSKVYDELVKMTANKNVNGHPYKVIQIENAEQALTSQIIFLADNKSSQLATLLKVSDGQPVMVVTEREGLVKKGAGFSFLVIDDKLRFDVNNTELARRSIKVSASLTSIANETL